MTEEKQIEVAEKPGYIRAIYGAEKHFNELVQSIGVGLKFKEEALHARIACEANEHMMKVASNNMLSLQKAVYSVATVGLSLNKATAYAYLVPRKGEICLDISYRGLIKIATDTGAIRWAKAEVVHENDEFIMRQMGQQPEHKFNPFGDRGKAVGVYCVAKTSDGDFLADAMSMEEINNIRDRSDGAGSKYSPWNTFPEEMWKKVVIKRASKTWPKTERSDRLHHAIEVVNEHEGIDFNTQHTPDQYTYYLQTINKDGPMPLEHYAFIWSLEYETRASLQGKYISDVKHGIKGKERLRIKAIYDEGEDAFMGILTNLDETEDEFETFEIISELSQETIDLLKEKMNPETLSRVEEATKMSEAA